MNRVDPSTPVADSAIVMWEREVERQTEALRAAQTRLKFSQEYLAELRRVRASQRQGTETKE